mmetsp:Transcript_37616/g.90706  ORF Transcript_37616/g.90706 Transcript_37616/m.90706 type:complete len:122 (-) Transcript_37616:215-580(-)
MSNEIVNNNLQTNSLQYPATTNGVVGECSQPTDNDVIIGKGASTHPGNVKFCQEASEYLSWYEHPTTSKKEKRDIAAMVVESVTSLGHRFLERGEDGMWHEVTGKEAKKEAIRTLRRRQSS